MTGALGIDIGGSSVKAAWLPDHGPAALAASGPYANPDGATLARSVREALNALPGARSGAAFVGLAVPGVLDETRARVVRSVNLPALEGLDLRAMACDALATSATVRVAPDALANAYGHWSDAPTPGRMLALVLGTGVGACVLDDGRPLRVTGASPGHFGQMDVGPCGMTETPVGPDGGRGSLEAYLGAPALRARFGHDLADALARLDENDPALVALARAVRVAHAIYRPDRVALLGGVGLALAPRLAPLRRLIDDHLTSLARPGWTLEAGASAHAGAVGAARLASEPE